MGYAVEVPPNGDNIYIFGGVFQSILFPSTALDWSIVENYLVAASNSRVARFTSTSGQVRPASSGLVILEVTRCQQQGFFVRC